MIEDLGKSHLSKSPPNPCKIRLCSHYAVSVFSFSQVLTRFSLCSCKFHFCRFTNYIFCSPLRHNLQNASIILCLYPPPSSPLSLPFPLSKTNYTAPFLLSFMSYLAMKLTHRTIINTAFMSIPLIITHFSTQLLHHLFSLFHPSHIHPFQLKHCIPSIFKGLGKKLERRRNTKNL